MELETPRLRLRPVAPHDRDDLLALERDPEVMRFLNGGAPTPEDGIDPDAGFLMPRGDEPGVWTALEKSSGAFVGWFCLYDRGDGTGELGYRLRRTMWGGGYATEGARRLVDYGFSGLGLVRIIADTMAVNQASRRVMERAGLIHVRTTYPEWKYPSPGSDRGDVEYEITRAAWLGRNSSVFVVI